MSIADTDGHKIAKPSRDVYQAFTSADAFFELPAQLLPEPSTRVRIALSEQEDAPASTGPSYTRHQLEPTTAQVHNFSRALNKAGQTACEVACNALECCQGFTRNPTTPQHQHQHKHQHQHQTAVKLPGDGSCWLYCGLTALASSHPRTYHSNITYQTIWLQKPGVPMPPVVDPPTPPPPSPPLDDEAYLQEQAISDLIKARAAQNFGTDLGYSMPAWVRGSVDGGVCRRPGARCNDTAWRRALAADTTDHGSYMYVVRVEESVHKTKTN